MYNIYNTFFHPKLFLVVSISTFSIILLASFLKSLSLRDGAPSVAADLNGVLIPPTTTNLKERRALNVVEEISIAAGIPVPRVYILEETGINAFVAGHKPSNTAIFFTKGAINNLTRSELQGITAHEFGHISNGDMRLNMILVSMLHGLLAIYLLGKNGFIMQSISFRVGRWSKKDRQVGIPGFLFMSLLLIIVGYIGVLLGRILKSAISREREFLADSFAVRFTRDKEAVINALKKVGGLITKGTILHPSGEEYNHFFFTDGIGEIMFGRYLSTHPSLNKRIKRLDPNDDCSFVEYYRYSDDLDGQYLSFNNEIVANQKYIESRKKSEVSYSHLAFAEFYMEKIPEDLKKMSGNSFDARIIIFDFLLSNDPVTFQKQMSILKQNLDYFTYEALVKLKKSYPLIDSELKIPLVELSISSLYQLSEYQYDFFRDVVKSMISFDHKIDTFEFLIMSIVLRRCDEVISKKQQRSKTCNSLSQMQQQISILFTALAQSGSDDISLAKSAFIKCAERYFSLLSIEFIDVINYHLLDRTLTDLSTLSEKMKTKVMEAAEYLILSDNKTTVDEIQLFRILGDYFDMIVPPMKISTNQ
ncbi:MAG: M48 family metalloprotease [Candidatus Cloacimonetes bacterium]|nr:M48 family metalloprotease [Candidatus Cloacimonadota bacterium]